VEEQNIDRRYLTMPHVERGMAVGLFGGSFNPPHEGHLLVAEIALRRLGLDQLWWIVTPGNPLKNHSELATLPERIEMSQKLIKDPRIKITAFEKTLGGSYTADALAVVKSKNPQAHFVWVMGADSLKSFHLWQKWRGIVSTFPIAVVDRPGSTLSFLSSKMARTFDYARIDEDDAGTLWKRKAPAWTFIHGPRSALSSTAIRAVNGRSDP
jgi:nicotinate-nucleotide adenylyltransferase